MLSIRSLMIGTPDLQRNKFPAIVQRMRSHRFNAAPAKLLSATLSGLLLSGLNLLASMALRLSLPLLR